MPFMKKNILLVLLILAGTMTKISAQQISSYAQYHMNPYLQCPAAAGSKPYVFVSAGYSQVWSGLRGAPNMQSGTVHALVSERVGVGGKVFYESTGLSGQFGAEASYAYHLPLGSGGTRLSLGVSALITQYSLHKSEFLLADPDDEVVNNAENSIIVPDAAFGFSFYHPDQFYVNYGVYQLFNRPVSFLNSDYLENRRARHHFLQAGVQIMAGEKLKLEPSVLLKLTESGMFQADLGLKSTIHDMLALGIYYKTGEAIVPYIGIDTKYLVFGYSYGIVTGDIKKYAVGTHEIMLILKINNGKTSL
jgi:type IX secretion system PorP/SprF family membrane protein